MQEPNLVSRPAHYNRHPSGIECIEITEHMNFVLGSAFKYMFRRENKGKELEDLKKAEWYIDWEIRRCFLKSESHLSVACDPQALEDLVARVTVHEQNKNIAAAMQLIVIAQLGRLPLRRLKDAALHLSREIHRLEVKCQKI